MLSRVCFTNTPVIAFGHTKPARRADDQVSFRREKKEEDNPDILPVLFGGGIAWAAFFAVGKLLVFLSGKPQPPTPKQASLVHPASDVIRRR